MTYIRHGERRTQSLLMAPFAFHGSEIELTLVGATERSRHKVLRRTAPREEKQTMSSFALRSELLAGSILMGVIAAAPIAPAVAQQKAAPPDFSSDNVGWVGLNGGGPFFEPVP